MKFLFALMVIIAMIFAAQAQFDKAACRLPKDAGPCRGSRSSFYFNAVDKACEPFLYGGCMGNGNRFDTNDACEKACL